MTVGADVVIVGGGVAGLGTALALSRHGHRVTVVERDATPLPPDPASAFWWDRRGAPQVRHSHAFLARLRNLLRDRHPEVLTALLAAGATEIRFMDLLPEEITDRDPRDGDDDLVALACRRTTFEWVLRQQVLADDRVVLRDGLAATGLTFGADPGPPVVTGVLVTGTGGPGTTAIEGDETGGVLPADIVVVATGRRSPLPSWLAARGIELAVTEEDTGIIYLSRFYRLRDGGERPSTSGPIGGDLGYLKYAVFEGDDRTFSVTFAVATGDDELRSALLDPDTFDAAARLLPATAAWADETRCEAITGVHVMAGLLNRQVRFLGDDGAPLALGIHAVGDAHTCTNPLYGRGCSLAVVMGELLADALAAHPDDPDARAKAYEAACAAEVEPWYRAAVVQDELSRREADREARQRAADADAGSDVACDTGPPPDTDTDTDTGTDPQATTEAFDAGDAMRAVLRDGLLPAVRTDAVVFRGFLRSLNLLDPPERLMSDPDLIGRVLAVYQDRDNRPAEPALGPPRAAMVAALLGT